MKMEILPQVTLALSFILMVPLFLMLWEAAALVVWIF